VGHRHPLFRPGHEQPRCDSPSLFHQVHALFHQVHARHCDAGGQLFDSLRNAGWLVKPLWGYVSDRIPLFGYHRKSWFVLMACLAVVLWMITAALAYAGVRVPLVT
jgi:hypothetical protein